MAEMVTVKFENAKLLGGPYRNFSGREGPFNNEGERNFCIYLEDDVAKQMEADIWNVKYTKVREEGDVPQAYLPVRVNFKQYPPRVVMITSTSRVQLNEDTVGTLDWANIQTCDLILNAREWNINGKIGIKAYLKTMFVTVEEDELERKYALQEMDEQR